MAQSLYDAAEGERGEDAVSARARLLDIRIKLGPVANLGCAHSLAQGAGIGLTRRTWRGPFSNAQELAIFGMSSLQGSPPAGSSAASSLGSGQGG